MQHICITGAGLIASTGDNIEQSWKAMCEGTIGIRKTKHWDSNGCQTDNYGEVVHSDEELLKSLKRNPVSQSKLPCERGELLFLKAFEDALFSSEYNESDFINKRVGIYIGTSLCGFTKLEREFTSYIKTGKPPSIKSMLVYPLNTITDRLAYEYKITGPRYLFSTACSASLHSVIWASEMLMNDEIDIAIIGGTDPLSLISMAGFSSLQSLSKNSTSPFSSTETGISIGEGAGVLFLEKATDVNINKRSVYVAGYAGSSDAYHPTASDPTGINIKLCIEKSLSNIIDLHDKQKYLVAHGTGTQHNDIVETRAIKQLEHLQGARVTSLKSMIGHTLGASGCIELALLGKSFNEQYALPTANFTEPRPGCDLNYVRNAGEQFQFDVGIKNAFAFGGNNVVASLVKDVNIIKDTKQNIDDSIVITGIGIVSGYDTCDTNAIMDMISSNRFGIKSIEGITGYRSQKKIQKAAIIQDDILDNMCAEYRIKNVRKMDRISKISAIGAASALRNAGYKITSQNSSKIGLVCGTGTGALESVHSFYSDVIKKGSAFANAGLFPNTVVNAHAGYINMENRIKGCTTVVSQGHTSDLAALVLSMKVLRTGMSDMVLVGSTAEYSSNYHKALIDIGCISDDYYPYDKDTNGYVLGEGSIFFVLERKSDALNRKANIYSTVLQCELIGTPTFPSTNRFDANPLSVALKNTQNIDDVSLIMGIGTGIKEHATQEISALHDFKHSIPFISASQYFGNISGVNSFNNLALYSLAQEVYQLPKVVNKCALTERINQKIETDVFAGNCLITSICEGGMGGMIVAKKGHV